MSAVLKDVVAPEGSPERYVSFFCPGCVKPHLVVIAGPRAWQFNGDMERPTFSPSYLLTKPAIPTATPPIPGVCCHSFIADGRIQYLSDCTHRLAGQTVPLPPAEAP